MHRISIAAVHQDVEVLDRPENLRERRSGRAHPTTAPHSDAIPPRTTIVTSWMEAWKPKLPGETKVT